MSEKEPCSLSPDKLAISSEFASSLELKEIINIFSERKTDRTEVLNIIEQALKEPIPAPTDLEAHEEYNSKMEMLKQLAKIYEERADELKQIWEEIEAHIIKPDAKQG